MKMDAHTLSDILAAHRRAMAAYRKECMPLGRNAIEVMLYAFGKHGITITEVSRNLLHSNVSQTKRVINTLVSKGVLWSSGKGTKGQPISYWITDKGYQLIAIYLKLLA